MNWAYELGHMAIFGGGVAHENDDDRLATEKDIYDHIMRQQSDTSGRSMTGGSEEEAAAVAPKEEEVGFLQILDFYTRNVVSDVEIWLRDESCRHVHYDEDTNKRGKFLAFEGVRFPEESRFKLHIELEDTVEATLQVIGSCAYGGDVPGDELEFTLEHLNAANIMNSFRVVEGVRSKTWREILMMKPVTWAHPININIEMTMRNPHAVVISTD